MSAYALPGSLFPPMGASCASYDNRRNVCSPLHHFSDVKEKKGSIGCDPSLDKQHSTKEQTEKSEVGIAVKEASIDPVRLVHSIAHGGSVSSDARSRKKQGAIRNRSSPASNNKATPHEDAIQFELAIKFNGRTYSATRTLPRIMELRSDLIRELNTRRQQLQSKRMRWQFRNTNDEQDDDDDDLDVTIPELPECDSEGASVQGTTSIAGRGFCLLQALLRSYCPAMERWLRNVMDLVPPNSSPSLTNFLWEPVSVQERKDDESPRMKNSPSLECIQEDDTAEEECDDREETEQ